MKDIKEIMDQMTLEEKAILCTGADFWHLHGVERLGIPEAMVIDGPHGLRKQEGKTDHLGLNLSKPATCFPSASALAASFDPALAERMGQLLGELAADEDVTNMLGPGMNIKRSPLCGRNFEYFSEDPLVASQMASGVVRGIQSQHVGACPKHFLANNQEHYRMTSNSVVDERTLREIYLAAFEETVRDAKPWAMMCSYNRINGTFACENKTFLRDILKDEWKFGGYVMTDWGALDDPVESLRAGLDVGMPGHVQDSVDRIIDAIQDGSLEEAVLDEAVFRILTAVMKHQAHLKKGKTYDFAKGHDAAREIAEQCAVLLKNEGNMLPLREDEQVLFVGEFARAPRYQGGGSSHVVPWQISSALDASASIPTVSWTDAEHALEKAAQADKVVIFTGLTDADETEGLDRHDLSMDSHQEKLIRDIAALQPNTVVVLHNGSPVLMPWLSEVRAVLEMYLCGEAAGEATVNLLYGRANPSGRLAETFPMRLEDTPAYPYYGRERNDVVYREGIMVGYRHYVTRRLPVLFPFGYGLSYTDYSYGNLKLHADQIKDTDPLIVSVDVTNTGSRDGMEVVQCYVSSRAGETVRPLRELRAFQKVFVQAGETVTVRFELNRRAFAWWSTENHTWQVDTGTYTIEIGKNAEDILLSQEVRVESTDHIKPQFTVNSPMGDILANPAGAQILGAAFAGMGQQEAAADADDEHAILNSEAQAAMSRGMPIRSFLSYAPGTTLAQFQQLIDAVNQAVQDA